GRRHAGDRKQRDVGALEGGGRVGGWRHVLDALLRPWKAVCAHSCARRRREPRNLLLAPVAADHCDGEFFPVQVCFPLPSANSESRIANSEWGRTMPITARYSLLTIRHSLFAYSFVSTPRVSKISRISVMYPMNFGSLRLFQLRG